MKNGLYLTYVKPILLALNPSNFSLLSIKLQNIAKTKLHFDISRQIGDTAENSKWRFFSLTFSF